jgi:hypothetical protein
MPVITVNRVVDTKRIIGKMEGRGGGEAQGVANPKREVNGILLIQAPKYHHPIFYGCFDWHSSVHGHWLLATLLRRFPDTPLAKSIVKVFDEQFKARQQSF